MNKRNVVIAAVAVAVAVGIVVALLQPRPEPVPDDGGTIIANNTEPEIVNVDSTRSAFPFVQRWVSQYNNDEGSEGRIEIGYYLDDPRAPGDLVIASDIQDASDLRYIPVSAQAAAIVYNIPSFPDIPSGLRLNSSILAQIFNGSIAEWDDPAIRDLNPSLNLPSERIVVVREAGNSSTLAMLESYLSADITWADNSIRSMGPDELASTVRTTPYSIGYVDFSYATQTRMTFAAVASDGRYIVPSADSISQAVKTGLQNATRNDIVMINSSRFDNSSYPLTGLYYASIGPESSNATLDFVDWMVNDGQQTLAEVQYPPIYRDNMLVAPEQKANSTIMEQ